MRRVTVFLLSLLLVFSNLNFTVTAQQPPVKVDIISNMVGNIFFDAKNAEFDVILGNNNGNSVSFNMEFKAYQIGTNMQRKESPIYELSKDYELLKTSEITENISVPLNGYGLYELEIKITEADGTENIYTAPFSNAVRNTKMSKTVGTGTHLGWYGDADSILYLVKNAGMGNIRNGIAWNEYERAKGVYQLTERQKKMFTAAQKYGIDVLQTLNPNNNVHDNGSVKSDFLREAEVEEYKAYLTAFLNEELVKNNVTKIEIMNEPESMFDVVDGETVSTDVAGHTKRAEAYVRMLRATNEVLGTIDDKDFKVGIFAVTGIFQDSPKNFADLVLSKLSPGEFDAVTVHSYSVYGKNPEYDWQRKSIREQADYFKKLANGTQKGNTTKNTYNFNVTEPMWHTEFGYSSATGEDSVNLSTGDEFIQATMLIRTIDELKRDNPDDLMYIYEMSSNGTDLTEREQNFEMVRSCYHEHPYSAKFAYLAVANYNSLTMEATEVSRVELGWLEQSKNHITKYVTPERDIYLLRATNDSTSSYNLGTENVYYYDLFGNKLNESDVKQNGKLKLTTTPFYAVVGKDIERAEPIADTKIQADEFVIRGRIPSGEEGLKISLTVTPENSAFGDSGFEDETIFMDQCYTKAGGTFEFKIKVYDEEAIKAYIVTENNDLMVLKFGIIKDESGAIKVKSNGIDISDLSFKQLDLSDLEVLVNVNETEYKTVCAIYDGERLVDLKILSENQVSFDKTTKECDKLQVMVIKDLETILPLCEVYVKK